MWWRLITACVCTYVQQFQTVWSEEGTEQAMPLEYLHTVHQSILYKGTYRTSILSSNILWGACAPKFEILVVQWLAMHKLYTVLSIK